jgi:hypothetical protein
MAESVEQIAESLTDGEREALRSIWPASKTLELSWPRWVSRDDVLSLERRGLVGEDDLTPLGKDVRTILALPTPSPSDTVNVDGEK